MSCDKNKEKATSDNYTIVLEHVNQDELQEIAEKNDLKGILGPIFGSTVEKNWRKLHRSCTKNKIMNDVVFLGTSNKLGLGTIFQKDFTTRDVIDLENFSEDELRELTTYGAESTCKFEQHITMNVEGLIDIDTTAFSAIDGSLGIAIANQKAMTASIGSYQQNTLSTGRLLNMLERSEKPRQKDYLEWLTEKGNLLVTSVIRIKGFSMDIEMKTQIDADLKAKLKQGIIGKLGNSDIQVKFKYDSDTKIKMVSENDFYVFGRISKVAKVKKR